VLSGKAASEPGKWTTSRAPYTREVMDAFSDPDTEEVAAMWASQLAKTEIILNVIGYYIDVDPCPIVVSQPTLNLARYFSRARLAPMIRATAPLAAKIAEPKSRDADNTTLSKGFTGGQLDIVSAQSASDLSARPARIALADEVDRYEDTSEGDPLDLLDTRTANFAFRKKGNFSSPRDKVKSRIEARYEASDKRKWWVPCPHCGRHQVLKWAQVLWDKATDAAGEELRDEDGHAIHLHKTARYFCEHCGVGWSEAERFAAIAAGEWRAEKPFAGIAGFWLNALNSPWQSLPRLVKRFLDSKDTPGKLRTFINTVLAQTYEDAGAQVNDDELVRRAEQAAYAVGDAIPAGAAVLTAAVDVQDDRLELEVVGWGRGYESWHVQHMVLTGDPALPELWKELDAILLQTWPTADGRHLPLRAVGIDSGGHHPDQVLRFCRVRWGRRVWALKGASKGLNERVWPTKFSRSRKDRHRLWVVNVDAAKLAVTDWLKVAEPGPGFCHFPRGTAPEYFKQYRAERLVTKYKNGFAVRVWKTNSGARNEALDMRGYNYAVLCGLEAQGLDLGREARRATAPAQPPPQPAAPAPQPTTAPPSGGANHFGHAPAGMTPAADPYL